MQERPTSHPPVLKEKRYLQPHPTVLNIITALCLVLATFLAIVGTFDYGDDLSLSDAWQTVHEGLQSGILLVQGEGPLLLGFFCVLPLIMWGVIVVVIIQKTSQRKQPPAKKSALVWAIILLGITVFLMGSLVAFGTRPCFDLFPYGSDPTCAMPIRPGVPIPTPYR